MKPIAQNVVQEIVKELKAGVSHRTLANKYQCSVGMISNIRKKYAENVTRNKAGRKPKLSDTIKRSIIRSIRSGEVDNAVQIKNRLKTFDNIHISAEGVRRALREAGMKGRAKVKKPLLTKRHMMLRLKFAKHYVNFSLQDWERVIWSDETKINRFGSDGKEWIWKKQNEKLSRRLVRPTIKFGGGNIMVWGCMTALGVGMAHRIDGRMTAKDYVNILNTSLVGSMQKLQLNIRDTIFQHDNDPKHTARITKSWLQSKGFNVLEWPPQSPDLNPIENLWSQLKKDMADFQETNSNLSLLWENVLNKWNQITSEQCKNLVESMPRRIQAVIDAKGGYTKY